MSGQEYTPTDEEVRTDYVMAYAERESSQLLAGAAFDRWLDRVKTDARAEGERAAVERIAEAIESVVDLAACECGHDLGEHNSRGCYAREYPDPDTTVACTCALTDDRDPGVMAQVAAARIARGEAGS